MAVSKLLYQEKVKPEEIEDALGYGARSLGYLELKAEQKRAISLILTGRDVLATLPTGYGKSVIYQALPYCATRVSERYSSKCSPIVIVVSPLIALMQDQVTNLKSRGVKAVYISSDTPQAEQENVVIGKFSHVFASPESLLQVNKWRKMLLSDVYRNNLVAIAIDEAHCIVKWGMGDHFREWYGRISQLRSLVPSEIPVVALTATATTSTKRKIISNLGMQNCDVVSSSPDRSNIRFSKIQVNKDLKVSFNWLITDLRKNRVHTSRTLVFCRSIHTCASLYKLFLTELQEQSYEPIGDHPTIQSRLFAMYHAKVDDEDKKKILESLSNLCGSIRVVFCTVAFGMGIDIPDIRTVIHYGPSVNLDDYFQEAGRAGRDGLQSNAILYCYAGCTFGHVSPAMKMYCASQDICRRKYLLEHFGYTPELTVSKHLCCDVCAKDCKCEDPCPFQPEVAETGPSHADFSDTIDEDVMDVREVTPSQRDDLRKNLLAYRLQQLQVVDCQDLVPLYIGAEFASGITNDLIESIVEHCHLIHNAVDLEEKYLVWTNSQDLIDIIDRSIGD